jgi:RHS repeat-associated protein
VGDGTKYIDEVLTMDLGGNTYYYHQNGLSSVEAITDSTATPVERYAYDAYGFVTVTNGSGAPVPQNAWGTPHSAIGNPYVFTGQRLDEESGLHYYRARYYSASEGRFIDRDPWNTPMERTCMSTSTMRRLSAPIRAASRRKVAAEWFLQARTSTTAISSSISYPATRGEK